MNEVWMFNVDGQSRD